MHRIYFLRKGTHIDSGEELETYTDEDLKEIRDSYSPSIFKSPIVLGHNEDISALYKNDKAPAYGFVEKLGLDKNGLFADVSLIKEFEELIDREVPPYKYVSAAIYERDNAFSPVKGKKYLRHIAFLGAQPPAIKSLPEPIKLYSENGLLNTVELFNNNKIININDMSVKKYMVEDMDSYRETITLPNPDTSSPEEIKSFLDSNAFDFLTYILTEGEYGYPGEITGFDVMPSEENNYLFNPETNSFSGVFYDDTSSEVDGYRFEIKKSGEGWFSSYIPVNQDEEGVDNFSEEEVEMVDAPIEDAEEEEEEVLSPTDESALASGEIPEVEEEEKEEEEVEEGDLVSELELMRSESRNLRNEVLKLRNELNEMKMNEYKAYSEKFNSMLSGTNIKSEEIASLLFQVDTSSKRLTKAYSEVTTQRPVELLKKVLEETLEKYNNHGIASYGEFMPEEEGEEDDLELETKPVGAVYSEDGIDMHKKVMSYCSKNNLNPKDISQYLEAYKAVCNA